MTREVTERDFRAPEFRDAKAEDYEFRGDGKLVRKDRWEQGIQRIREIVDISAREFEIPDVVQAVRDLKRPKPKHLMEWTEEDGAVLWWCWCEKSGEWLGEAPYIGSPNVNTWPNYHTHWTPLPPFPEEQA